MKDISKLILVGIFVLFGLGVVVSHRASSITATVFAQANPTPPDPKSEAKPSTEAKETPAVSPKPDAVGDKKIPKDFTLGTDSFSEYGEVGFNHDTHALLKYSPDGKSVVGCAECHHTDQPKSALKPPLLTSERDVLLTMDSWQKSSQKVTRCRDCHYQVGEVPDDKEMPFAVYKDGEKETTKELNNELAYHINCNTCHDAAYKLRPDLKKKAGFSTTKDCMICHKEN